jgi:hypothetical protein
MKALARALVTAVAFLELSDDDVVDPDAACGILEDVARELSRATPKERHALQIALAQMRASEELNANREEILEFLDTFLSAFGLKEGTD